MKAHMQVNIIILKNALAQALRINCSIVTQELLAILVHVSFKALDVCDIAHKKCAHNSRKDNCDTTCCHLQIIRMQQSDCFHP